MQDHIKLIRSPDTMTTTFCHCLPGTDHEPSCPMAGNVTRHQDPDHCNCDLGIDLAHGPECAARLTGESAVMTLKTRETGRPDRPEHGMMP